MSSVRIANLNPSPSAPRRFATGIAQSEKCSATVGEARGRAYDAVELVSFDGARFRSDIGAASRG